MIITKEFIEKGATNGKGVTCNQFRVLGVGYPPMKGWKKSLIGKEISEDKAKTYLELKGVKAREFRKFQKGKRLKDKIHNLDMTILSYDVARDIKDMIKTKPINMTGLKYLDSFLSQIRDGQTLSDKQIDIVKRAEAYYPDKELICVEETYVYLALEKNENKNKSIVKIGYSKNPKRRIKDLQTANPGVKLIAYAHGSLRSEKRLHIMFSKYRTQREWFAFPMTKKETIETFNKAVAEVNGKNTVLSNYRDFLIRKWNVDYKPAKKEYKSFSMVEIPKYE